MSSCSNAGDRNQNVQLELHVVTASEGNGAGLGERSEVPALRP
ncbi:hypothetical protein SV7mr_50950 [Stieleria bergensis]|uniref:Uncharacterized protein n=1 Tax=Stieleria bergensis TaxID=2528025 RepID=A0A517T2D8_9BACT|nr:hypothetical protein SV7mr_50950 [Planctomycetes bacterium SV_7m_r]